MNVSGAVTTSVLTANNSCWSNSHDSQGGSSFDLVVRGDLHQNGGGDYSRGSSSSAVMISTKNLMPSQGQDSLMKTAATAIPFLMDDNDLGITSLNEKETLAGGCDKGGEKDKMDFPVDMDMDSPFSPQSSEMSDIFEPPLDTPLTNKKMSNMGMKLRSHKNITPSAANKQALGKSVQTIYKGVFGPN